MVQTQNRSDEEMQPFEWGGERGWRGFEPSAGRGGFATRAHREPSSHRGAPSARMHDEQRSAWLGEEPGRFGNRGPKDYQRSDDRIREDVCDRLTADTAVDATNLTVTVKDAEVTLEGTVDDRGMKRRAEDCADHVPGVRQVHNRLLVQPQHGIAGEPATSIGTAASAAATGGTAATGSGRG
ncbi:MAG: BON domain-containing protein [bacterium]|nr:BON domain-containing protein [bacterium]